VDVLHILARHTFQQDSKKTGTHGKIIPGEKQALIQFKVQSQVQQLCQEQEEIISNQKNLVMQSTNLENCAGRITATTLCVTAVCLKIATTCQLQVMILTAAEGVVRQHPSMIHPDFAKSLFLLWKRMIAPQIASQWAFFLKGMHVICQACVIMFNSMSILLFMIFSLSV
jgi:hypothetical protein